MAFGSGNLLFPDYQGLGTGGWKETTAAGVDVTTYALVDTGPRAAAFLADGTLCASDRNGNSSTDNFDVFNTTPTLLNSQSVTSFSSFMS
jgi:hypothetical protein